MKRFFSFDSFGFTLLGVRFTLALCIFDHSSSSSTTLNDQSAVSSQYGDVVREDTSQNVRSSVGGNLTVTATDYGSIKEALDTAGSAVSISHDNLQSALDFASGTFGTNVNAVNSAAGVVSDGFTKILDFASSLVGKTISTLNRTNDALQGGAAETLKLASVIQDNGKAQTQKQNNTTLIVLALVSVLPALLKKGK